MQLTDDQLKCAVNSVFLEYDKDKNGILDFDEMKLLVNSSLLKLELKREASEDDIHKMI